MPESVPSQGEVQATFASTLLDQWIGLGLRDVVVCPGSRSTPLVIACASRRELRLHVRLDERSAAFFALGRALVTKVPVAIFVTSGTAAAELHAAVCEADAACVPLLIVTADRPPELHGVGAPQTIDQQNLYGNAVRRFEDPGVARWDASHSWRPLATRLWRTARGTSAPAGPVHLNAAFVEPLVGTSGALPTPMHDEYADLPHAVASTSHVESLVGTRVMAVVGSGVAPSVVEQCRQLDWVVLGDATAQGTLSYYDPLLRSDRMASTLRPDVVVRIGGLPASKCLQERLREWGVRVIAYEGAGPVADPDGLVSLRQQGLPTDTVPSLRADASYAQQWMDASRAVDDLMDSLESDDDRLNEISVARLVVDVAGEHDVALVVGSSMPVRDVEWWSGPRRSPTFANRGVNGIDGVVSTVLGVSAGAQGIGLVGDLTMLHDVSGFVDGLGGAGGSCVLVVNDNRGGGIFSFLPQARELAHDDFERLFATPRLHNLEEVVKGFGHDGTTVTTRGALRVAMEKGLSGAGVHVVVAQVPERDENVLIHERMNDLVGRSVAL